MGPTGHGRGATNQRSEKMLRNDSESGCRGCLYSIKNMKTPLKTQKKQHPTENQNNAKYQDVN